MLVILDYFVKISRMSCHSMLVIQSNCAWSYLIWSRSIYVPFFLFLGPGLARPRPS